MSVQGWNQTRDNSGQSTINTGGAITDVVIATYALGGYLALSHGRPLTAGVLFGLAQSCKLLPGPSFLKMFGS